MRIILSLMIWKFTGGLQDDRLGELAARPDGDGGAGAGRDRPAGPARLTERHVELRRLLPQRIGDDRDVDRHGPGAGRDALAAPPEGGVVHVGFGAGLLGPPDERQLTAVTADAL